MKLLSTASVLDRLDRSSKETIRQMVKRGDLPPPIRSERGGGNFWLESEIESAIQRMAAERDSRIAQHPQTATA